MLSNYEIITFGNISCDDRYGNTILKSWHLRRLCSTHWYIPLWIESCHASCVDICCAPHSVDCSRLYWPGLQWSIELKHNYNSQNISLALLICIFGYSYSILVPVTVSLFFLLYVKDFVCNNIFIFSLDSKFIVNFFSQILCLFLYSEVISKSLKIFLSKTFALLYPLFISVLLWIFNLLFCSFSAGLRFWSTLVYHRVCQALCRSITLYSLFHTLFFF